MTNLKLSLIVDVLMLVALIVTVAAALGNNFDLHQTAAWIFLGLIVVHLVLHRFYIKNFFQILGRK